MKKLHLSLLMLLIGVWAMASNTSVKNAEGVEIWYDFDSSAKTASVTYAGKYSTSFSDEYTGEVVIPSKVTYEDKEYSVTSIGDYAFYECSSLTSITIPEGVTEIGEDAFEYCSSLTSIDVALDNNRYTSIDGVLFSKDKTILLKYPEGKKDVTSYAIPEGVTSIKKYAFYDCSSLTSITIPKSVTWIGSNAFSNCSSLTSITIPEGVTEIGDCAFYECSSLTSITIPEGVTEIGDWAFYECSSLTSIDVASNNNSYTSINGVLFSKDKTILIKYPEGKKDVTSYAIPEGVTEIGVVAFSNCSSLTSITIPESVTSIGSSAFDGCYKLYEVYNKSNLTIKAGRWNNGYVAYYAKKVYTDESGESKLHTVGDYIFYVDEDNIELLVYLGDETAITLPSDYEGKDYIIANYGFYGCTSLKSITIPVGVTTIGDRAFYECSSLTSITLPEGVTTIGNSAFAYCSSLTSITIPEGVTSIGNDAFYECSSLTSITIPEGMTKIGVEAFGNCSGLTSITSMNVTPPSMDDSYTFDGVDKSIPVYVPMQSVEAYKSDKDWKEFTNIQGIDDTPISDVDANSVSIRLIGNSLIVEGAESYAVYALSGQCLGKVESLERGLYIVVADGVSKRIVVK